MYIRASYITKHILNNFFLSSNILCDPVLSSSIRADASSAGPVLTSYTIILNDVKIRSITRCQERVSPLAPNSLLKLPAEQETDQASRDQLHHYTRERHRLSRLSHRDDYLLGQGIEFLVTLTYSWDGKHQALLSTTKKAETLSCTASFSS